MKSLLFRWPKEAGSRTNCLIQAILLILCELRPEGSRLIGIAFLIGLLLLQALDNRQPPGAVGSYRCRNGEK